jgi:hypothetical protein
VVEKGVFVHELPVWFEAQKEYSIAQWVLYYFERALWIQFEAHVKQVPAVVMQSGRKEIVHDQTGKESLLAAKDVDKVPLFISSENRLVSFKQQILPYWTDVCKKYIQERGLNKMAESWLRDLFVEFKSIAEETILQPIEVTAETTSVNWLTGGIASTNRMLDRISEKQRMSKLFEDDLRILKIRFEQIASDDTP